MALPQRFEDVGLVVVGGSVAGMIAALTAADRGHRVALIERNKDLGGLAASCAETLAAAGTRFQGGANIADKAALFLGDAKSALGNTADPAVTGAVVGQAVALVEWLADRCGVQIALQSTTATGGHGRARLHSVGEQGGASLATALVRAASRHTHIHLRTGTEVDRLIATDDGGVAGVGLKADRRGTTIVRGPVVLACGGFAGNDELVAEHCPAAKDLPYVAATGSTGDAIRLAGPLGASLHNASACAVTPLLAQPSHFAVTRAVLDRGGILVNQRSERFTDETQANLPLALAVRAQLGRIAYLLFDERIATAVGAQDPYFTRVVLPRTARRADSIAMFSKQLEIALPGLTATLEAHARTGSATAPGLAEPFYGVRVTGARQATLGGLAVDASAHVLDAMGNAIPGLFAVGGAAAGLGFDAADRGLVGMEALTGLALARLAAQGLAAISDDG